MSIFCQALINLSKLRKGIKLKLGDFSSYIYQAIIMQNLTT